MGLFDWFAGKRPPIRDRAELADFIDGNAAFLMQKGIYEYSRARAGHYAKVLFREPEFQAAVETSRWRAYPLGLVMVGEMVEGVLRAHVGGAAPRGARSAERDRARCLRPLSGARRAERGRVARACAPSSRAGSSLSGLHPPKRAMDIPEQWAQTYFDLMPIHEKLRGRDFPTTRNYLRVAMCNIHDEFSERLDDPPSCRHCPACAA